MPHHNTVHGAVCLAFLFRLVLLTVVSTKKLKLRLKNTIRDKTLTDASETRILSKRDRTQINFFERKVYRRILSPGYDNEKKTGEY
jgi:hypothetical protein